MMYAAPRRKDPGLYKALKWTWYATAWVLVTLVSSYRLPVLHDWIVRLLTWVPNGADGFPFIFTIPELVALVATVYLTAALWKKGPA